MRQVTTVAAAEDVFFDDLALLSSDCAASVYFYLGALETEDPEITEVNDEDCELCGAIAVRYEVFSARIPGCRSHRMYLTIDREKNTVFVHAIPKTRKRNATEAHRTAALQLKLDGKPWEARHDETNA